MQWFKHHSNFRNSPALKYIDDIMGDQGVAAVYRLYEVMTERFGVDNNFTGSLFLSPPYSETWLAEEILRADDDGYDRSPTAKELRRFLAECETAGIVQIKREMSGVSRTQDDGSNKETGEQREWWTITIPGFAGLADEYTARKRTSRSLETVKS